MTCYFFCGIGGSGMLPLAVLLHKSGHKIFGSDRSYDQGKNHDKFQSLKDIGIHIVPQDGLAIDKNIDILVVSSAVEKTIADVKAAIDNNIPIITRGKLLAELFNDANTNIAIAGTSGKSTVTGMIATILTEIGQDPTVVNGGNIRNFDDTKFSNMRKGHSDLFIAEMDESDGSIAHYNPSISILNNIALDHKTIEELEQLFGDYLNRTTNTIIANYDQPRVKKLCANQAKTRVISYGINNDEADIIASDLEHNIDGVSFNIKYNNSKYKVALNISGKHNVENALAAISGIMAVGVEIEQGIEALQKFKGIHRRMEFIGRKNGISVFDDFAHNPDKISASLQSLKDFNGRLIIMFQPHGFGPLRLMGKEMIDAFVKYLDKDDILIMPEVYYAGGTTDRSVTAKHIITDLKSRGVNAHWFSERSKTPEFISETKKEGDRIIVMGARDDTLNNFARGILDE